MLYRDAVLEESDTRFAPWRALGAARGAWNEVELRLALTKNGYQVVLAARSELEFSFSGAAVALLIDDPELRSRARLRTALNARFRSRPPALREALWRRLEPQIFSVSAALFWESAKSVQAFAAERLLDAAQTGLRAKLPEEQAQRLLRLQDAAFAGLSKRGALAWPTLSRATAPIPPHHGPAPNIWNLHELARYTVAKRLFLGSRTHPELGDWSAAGAAGAAFACLWPQIAVVLAWPELRLDGQGRLHSSEGPALRWPGLGAGRYYFLHGTEVPERLVLEPERISRGDVLSITDSEVSRAMAERIGWEKYLQLAGATVVDQWTDAATGCSYELYSVGVPRLRSIMRLLKMQSPMLKDGTRPFYIEPVPAALATCRAARKWQFRLPNGRWPRIEQCNEDPGLAFDSES